MSPLPPFVRYVHAEDGLRLGLTIFEPRGSPRGAFLLVHGFSQNRQAFLEGRLPRRLAELGFWAFVGELRGHGLSERPTTWTFQDHLYRDLPALIDFVRTYAPASPIHYMGHSMGGILGYLSLAQAPLPWASITGLAAPMRLGRGSPLVGLAARLVWPFARPRPGLAVPMDRFLGALAKPLAAAQPQAPLRMAQRVLALANPREASPDAVREVLSSSDPESMEVFRTFLSYVISPGSGLEGIVIEDAVRAAPIPIAAVVGGLDIFAPPPSVSTLTRGPHQGPRRVVALPRASHVDLTLGDAIVQTVEGLLPFLDVP